MLNRHLFFVALIALLPAPFSDVVTEKEKLDDNAEIAKLFTQDQAARRNFLSFNKDQLNDMVKEDRRRRKRTYEIYKAGDLKTGADFYHAAMILQHGSSPEDFLSAHELAVASICLGEERGKWLAAAAEDRFLKSIGRKQRFATQFGKDDKPESKWELYPVDSQVTDRLRKIMNCPSLEKAELQEKKLNQG